MNASGARLGALTKQLFLDWQQTRDSWRDARGQEFESKYMLELFDSAEKTVAVIEQLDKLINKIRKDCE